MKVLKSLGLSWMSVSRTMCTTPLPSRSSSRSFTSKERSPKKRSAPCCSNSIIFRRMVFTEAELTWP